ncbi:vomeronasal type-1 receptor 4-like [Suncus etruscus]|uniref:vomeronasal type-1 receptor 4-like n=1 Tax=Suncus etruscus TaxID=109475 RepID=UPI0021106DD7|nr:vomeronasal type-1 receptor 4-like [Suncus etruscus]
MSTDLSQMTGWSERISFRDLIVGGIILSEILLGTLGNFNLLYHYLLCYHTEGRLRPTEFILMHLTVSNSLLILSNGLPQTMAAFGLKHFLSNLGCDLVLYIQRVGKGVSIGTTCLLNVFQAIMISPLDSCWKDLKVKAPKYVTLSICLYWILCMFVNLIFPLHKFNIFHDWSMENITQKQDLGYCYTTNVEKLSSAVYSALIVFPEIFISVLLIWTSGSMILFLYRHKQRVQHIHSNHVFLISSVEFRAMQRILVLVSAFLYFHTFSSILHMCVTLLSEENGWLFNAAGIISLCFPTVSPFLVRRHPSTLSRQTLFLIMNRYPQID